MRARNAVVLVLDFAVEASTHDVHVDFPDRLGEEVAAFTATLPP